MEGLVSSKGASCKTAGQILGGRFLKRHRKQVLERVGGPLLVLDTLSYVLKIVWKHGLA